MCIGKGRNFNPWSSRLGWHGWPDDPDKVHRDPLHPDPLHAAEAHADRVDSGSELSCDKLSGTDLSDSEGSGTHPDLVVGGLENCDVRSAPDVGATADQPKVGGKGDATLPLESWDSPTAPPSVSRPTSRPQSSDDSRHASYDVRLGYAHSPAVTRFDRQRRRAHRPSGFYDANGMAATWADLDARRGLHRTTGRGSEAPEARPNAASNESTANRSTANGTSPPTTIGENRHDGSTAPDDKRQTPVPQLPRPETPRVGRPASPGTTVPGVPQLATPEHARTGQNPGKGQGADRESETIANPTRAADEYDIG